jgi:hypothetical protein
MRKETKLNISSPFKTFSSMKLLHKNCLEGFTLSLCKFNMSYRRLCIVIAVMYCGFASFSTQAQSLDTLRLTSVYNNGIAAMDTLLPYRAKMVIPQSIVLTNGSSGTYGVRLRYVREVNDTVSLDYAVNGDPSFRIGALSDEVADTIHTNYLSFAMVQTPEQSAEAQASVKILYREIFEVPVPLAVGDVCATDSLACERICNNGFNLITPAVAQSAAENFGCPIGGSRINQLQSWFAVDNNPANNANILPTGDRTPDYYGICNTGQNLLPPFNPSYGIPNNVYGAQAENTLDCQADGFYAGVAIRHTREAVNQQSLSAWLERVKQRISTPLLNNRQYVASFSTSLAGKAQRASSMLSMQVLTGGNVHTITSDTVIQDTLRWTTVSGTFTATGDTAFITVGAPIVQPTDTLPAMTVRTLIPPAHIFNGAYYYITQVA